MSANSYPAFVPPGDLATSDRWNWDLPFARRYLTWMRSSLEGRVATLLAHLQIDPSTASEALLDRAGARAAQLLELPPYSNAELGELRLSPIGHALSADLGLLVARELISASAGMLHWKVVRMPKRDVSYNLPALFGFTSGTFLEPVGGSIAEARAVLRGTRGSNAWLLMFEHWSSYIPGAAV